MTNPQENPKTPLSIDKETLHKLTPGGSEAPKASPSGDTCPDEPTGPLISDRTCADGAGK